MRISEYRCRAGFHLRCTQLGAAIILLLCSAHGAIAQALVSNPTPEMYVANNQGGSKVVPNGQLSFDGQPFTCGKFPTVLDPLLGDYAAAPYKGFIIINPKLLAKVPTAVKLWIFHHECGHALGIADESKADCFSVQRGRSAGWLTPEGLDQVCEFISAGKADARHPAGPDRCAAMRTCYRQSDVKAGGINNGR